MNTDAIQVRPARSDDRDRILALHLDAFGDDEGPVIARLVEEMLDDPTAEPIYSFVAESEKKVVGHVLFTSVTIEPASDSNDGANAQILAPLAVTRDLHGQGIGSRLVTDGFLHLHKAGVELVFVLGYPDYYSRFGFNPAGVQGLQATYSIPPQNAGAWMVKELTLGVIENCEGTVRCSNALDDPKYWIE